MHWKKYRLSLHLLVKALNRSFTLSHLSATFQVNTQYDCILHIERIDLNFDGYILYSISESHREVIKTAYDTKEMHFRYNVFRQVAF